MSRRETDRDCSIAGVKAGRNACPTFLRGIAGALLLVWPAASYANVPLPTIFAFYPQALLGWTVFLGAFAAVLGIETVVLATLFRQPWKQSFGTVLRANALSTAFGLTLTIHPLELFAVIVSFFVILKLAETRFHWGVARRYPLALVCCVGLVATMVPWGGIPATVAQTYVTMLVAFGLSVLLESFLLVRQAHIPRKSLRWSLGMNAASYMVLLLFLWAVNFRTGAFALREWHVYNIIREKGADTDRERTLERLAEFYAWQHSGKDMRIVSQANDNTVYGEIDLVRRWAEAGYTTDALRLMQMLRDTGTSVGLEQFWQQAEQALDASLRVRQTSHQ